MSKKKKLGLGALSMVILVLAVLCTLRIRKVNAMLPIPVSTYQMNEAVNLRNRYEVSVVNVDFDDMDSLLEKYHINEEDYTAYDPTDEKWGKSERRLAVITIEIHNPTNEVQTAEVVPSVNLLCKETDPSGSNIPLFNPDGSSIYMQLEPNQTVQVVLPYNFREPHYTTKGWEQIDTAPMELVLQNYPEKKVVTLRE